MTWSQGYSSTINARGVQPLSLAIRHDCTAETAMAFAVSAAVTGNASEAQVARNLLHYMYTHSGFPQPWNVGGGGGSWVAAGDAMGLVAWESSAGAYTRFYSDDNARGLLGAIAAASLLGTDRFHSTIAAGTLANLRITGTNGFELSSASFESLGPWWEHYDKPGPAKFSPHYVRCDATGTLALRRPLTLPCPQLHLVSAFVGTCAERLRPAAPKGHGWAVCDDARIPVEMGPHGQRDRDAEGKDTAAAGLARKGQRHGAAPPVAWDGRGWHADAPVVRHRG